MGHSCIGQLLEVLEGVGVRIGESAKLAPCIFGGVIKDAEVSYVDFVYGCVGNRVLASHLVMVSSLT